MTSWDYAKGRLMYDALVVVLIFAGIIGFATVGIVASAIQGRRRSRRLNRMRP